MTEVRRYALVFVALLVLTAVTVFVSYLDLGPFGTPVALGIAAVKATLVLLFFMHLRDAPEILWLAAGAGFFWLAILVALTMADVATRGLVPIPGK
ncbi:MAG TPA: cytochrome C oxidase subunit IV family protein [Candidatus Binatia bacterium]|nr:cytochrome C oxidase subunit IV family protein [Candidatus Binatia bacterium]